MPAAAGAIRAVQLTEDDTISYEVIQDEPAAGICGSGILDALAVMLETEVMDDSGYLELEDEEEVRSLYLVEQLAPLGYDDELLVTDRIYARRGAAREWLREQGFDPDEIFIFEDDTRALEAHAAVDARAASGMSSLSKWQGVQEAYDCWAQRLKERLAEFRAK